MKDSNQLLNRHSVLTKGTRYNLPLIKLGLNDCTVLHFQKLREKVLNDLLNDNTINYDRTRDIINLFDVIRLAFTQYDVVPTDIDKYFI